MEKRPREWMSCPFMVLPCKQQPSEQIKECKRLEWFPQVIWNKGDMKLVYHKSYDSILPCIFNEKLISWVKNILNEIRMASEGMVAFNKNIIEFSFGLFK